MTTSDRRSELAFNMGAMFVRALQDDYSLVDLYAKEFQIDFKDGKPYCPKFDFLSRERRILEKVNTLADHLMFILPMAKGYAYQNNVGKNVEMVNNAEEALRIIDDLLDGKGKHGT